MAIEVPDMTGWTGAQEAEWYYQHRDHIDEVFNDGTQEFTTDPDKTLTTREVVMTLREAEAYDAKLAHQARILQHQ